MKTAPFFLGAAFLSSLVFAEEKHPKGDVDDVVVIDQLEDDSIYEKIWQPFIARWKSKYLIASYGLQLRGKPDMGDIVCSISKDDGKTWSPPIIIFDHRVANGTQRFAYNNSVLFKAPDQDVIWCYSMRCPTYYPNSEDSELCAAYSADGGASWNHVELTVNYHGACITCAGIVTLEEEGQKRYLLPIHRNTYRSDPKGSRDQFVLESRDLLTWKLSSYIPYPEDQPVFLHEGSIARSDSPEELRIVMRTATYDREKVMDPPLAWSSYSEDGGRTWSIAEPEPDLPNFRAKSFYDRGSNGLLLYIYNDHSDRNGLFYKTREVGENWSEEQVFFDAGTRNSYPTLVEDKPGEWLAVWDSSFDRDRKRTAIRFGRFTPRK